ncbi:MAG: class I SAM-dependent methyltransferase [Thermodesulfobacteriota bacterium]
MNMITTDALASMQFALKWNHGQVSHTDGYFARKVNMWRDCFPKPLYDALIGRENGATITLDKIPGGSLPAFNPNQVVTLPLDRFNRKFRDNVLVPRYGRFYPKGALSGVANIFPDNMAPFRYGPADGTVFEADLNHPLAGREVALSVRIDKIFDKIDERGGTCVDWIETVSDGGPGMQARMNGRPTDFFSGAPFERPDNRPDKVFYETPRMVDHLDAKARELITGLYARLLPPGGAVLDLMSSWNSHLPADMAFSRVTGLGLNEQELAANPRLADYTVRDLNADPTLPYDDGAFSAVICSASVEYLISPLAVFDEVARVLAPGGVFIVTFSNRWFPPKAISLWTTCHEFERLGLATEYFLQSGKYDKLHTWSMRGYPRPADDKYYPEQPLSDPVYAVWGYRK